MQYLYLLLLSSIGIEKCSNEVLHILRVQFYCKLVWFLIFQKLIHNHKVNFSTKRERERIFGSSVFNLVWHTDVLPCQIDNRVFYRAIILEEVGPGSVFAKFHSIHSEVKGSYLYYYIFNVESGRISQFDYICLNGRQVLSLYFATTCFVYTEYKSTKSEFIDEYTALELVLFLVICNMYPFWRDIYFINQVTSNFVFHDDCGIRA